jgi:Ca2+:H+ antiporter
MAPQRYSAARARAPIPMMAPTCSAGSIAGRCYIFGGYAVAFVSSRSRTCSALPPLVRFGVAVIALAGGAVAVGESTSASRRLSPRRPASSSRPRQPARAVPAIFALQAGLLQVVAAALVGSVLGNALFVLGLATLVGGLRHGKLTFSAAANRLYATELLLGVARSDVPFLATQPGRAGLRPRAGAVGGRRDRPARRLRRSRSRSRSGLSSRRAAAEAHVPEDDDRRRPTRRAARPDARPARRLGGLGRLRRGLVRGGPASRRWRDRHERGVRRLIVVALASNAVENLAGVTAAAKEPGDLSMSLILNSALQIVLFLTPVIVLLSFFVAPVPLTLILSPLLLGLAAVTRPARLVIVTDGEANALEGAMLLGPVRDHRRRRLVGPADRHADSHAPRPRIRGTIAPHDDLAGARARRRPIARRRDGHDAHGQRPRVRRSARALEPRAPEIIRRVQRAYLDAGAQVLLTNTFGGNRLRLELHGARTASTS